MNDDYDGGRISGAAEKDKREGGEAAGFGARAWSRCCRGRGLWGRWVRQRRRANSRFLTSFGMTDSCSGPSCYTGCLRMTRLSLHDKAFFALQSRTTRCTKADATAIACTTVRFERQRKRRHRRAGQAALRRYAACSYAGGGRRIAGRRLIARLDGRRRLPTYQPPFDSSQGDGTITIYAQAESRMPANLVINLAIADIDKNPFQTRYVEDDETLEELADSIKANGVVQPIMVRPAEEDGRYILILGERRLHASKKAGKTHIPALVRRVSLQQAAEMTIVENLQREDLSALEQAEAFRVLSNEFNLTQQQIGSGWACRERR